MSVLPRRAGRKRGALDWVVAVVFGALILGSAIAAIWVGRHVVAIHRLQSGVGDTMFYSADGRPWFRMDEQRSDVPIARIAPILRQAVIAVEDHRFYRHLGLDPLGIGRAVVENLRRDSLQGASTITQQLARTLFLSNQRTWGRKFKEAVLAVMLEAQLSKEQILELYLNRVYLSSGVYGVEPLSRRLWGKPAADLGLVEAAVIAGLIRAPSALSPWSNYEGALERMRVVLLRMREERVITAQQQASAARQRPRIRPYQLAIDARAGYAKEYVRQQFRNQFGGDHPPDWQVRTTIDLELQAAAERAVSNGLQRSGKRDLQAALVALDPTSGNVLAVVGGRDFRTTSFNRAVRAKRQPGSAFKPLVYAAALSSGWSPVSVVSGLSAVSAVDGDEEWRPRDAKDGIKEAVTLREALIESDNRAAVAVQQRIGTRAVLQLARRVDLRGLPDVPSLALGTGLVTPLEMAHAYAMFANGGFAVETRAITSVLDAEGDTAYDNPSTPESVLSPQAAFQMVSMLRDVAERGTVASVLRAAGLRFPVAGKTGTTNDYKDAWFVGFSSSMVVAVWVGEDQPATMGPGASGARLAAPIWADFMRQATRRAPPAAFVEPSGLTRVELCHASYMKPVDGCPGYTEFFKDGDDQPSRLCPIHRGNLRQRAERVFDGVIDGLANKIIGIFRKR